MSDDTIGFDRRTVLKTVGTGITLGGGTLASTPAAARAAGELPNDDVPTELVSIFAGRADPRQVSAGTWLEHTHAWIDREGGDRTKADVERYLDAVETTHWIDGERVENSGQYWGEIVPKDGSWYVPWEYYTPPKSPGLHTFTAEFYFPDGFEDLSEDEDATNLDIAPGSTTTLTGFYEVERPSSGSNRAE